MINLFIALWLLLFIVNVVKINNIKYLKAIIIIECIIVVVLISIKFFM